MDWTLLLATVAGALIAIAGSLLQVHYSERASKRDSHEKRDFDWAQAALARSTAVFAAANALVARAKADGTHPTSAESEELFSAFQHACDEASLYVAKDALEPLEKYRRSLVVWANELFASKDAQEMSEERTNAGNDLAQFKKAVRKKHSLSAQ